MRSILAAVILLMASLSFPAPAKAECYPVPITANTPSGIAGCEHWGEGIASHYGPGSGVAMNFCTWTLRHTQGCGVVRVTSLDTGLAATVPVVDFCDCYQRPGPNGERARIVDLQWGVVDALALDRVRGLYRVTVWSAGATLPDTALAP